MSNQPTETEVLHLTQEDENREEVVGNPENNQIDLSDDESGKSICYSEPRKQKQKSEFFQRRKISQQPPNYRNKLKETINKIQVSSKKSAFSHKFGSIASRNLS